MKQIKSLDELKKAAASENGDFTEFFMLLGGGLARSSKRILFFPQTGTFDVINEIDDSFQEDLTDEQLESETNIMDAISAGAFFQYED